jgi:hypothetical protein
MAKMETGFADRYSGNPNSLASRRIQDVLELAFPSSEHHGTKASCKRNTSVDFSHGGRVSDLGAPRIHGELLKLGFDLSERPVSRWVQRAPKGPEPARRWQAFLHNHREVIAAMDFFTVPTLTFGVLYCFFVIAHDRRRMRLLRNAEYGSEPAA